MSDNVVLFPRMKLLQSPPQSIEEVRLRVAENKTAFAISVADNILDNIIFELNSAGFCVGADEDDAETVALITLAQQSILAACLELNGISHPLSAMAVSLYSKTASAIPETTTYSSEDEEVVS